MDFSELIDNYIAKKRANSVHVSVFGKYSPSQLSNTCLRAAYFSATIEEVELAPEKLRIFEMGNVLHEFAVAVLKDSGKYSRVEDETRFLCVVPHPTDVITISGRSDAVATDEKGNIVVFEFKSIYSLRYVKEAPVVEHVRQLQLYLGCLHAQKGYIIYIEKQSLDSCSHEIAYDHMLFLSLLKDIEKLHTCVKNKTPPLRTYPESRDIYPCTYCFFKKDCEEDEIQREAEELLK